MQEITKRLTNFHSVKGQRLCSDLIEVFGLIEVYWN